MLPPEGFAMVPTKLGCTGEVVAGFPPASSKSGGHNDAHPPTHLIVPPFSGKNTYRVRPPPLVRIAPIPGALWVASLLIPPSAVLVVGVDALLVAGVAAGVDLLDDELLLPQAAASSASGTTRSRAGDLIRALVQRSVGAPTVPLPTSRRHCHS